MAQICETCKHKGDRCYCAPNSTCSAYEKRTIAQFDAFKLMNIEELADWICKHNSFENSPWSAWWDENYCQKCESVIAFVPYLNGEYECAWCETNGKCRFFQELNEIPSLKDIIKMWLESEVE